MFNQHNQSNMNTKKKREEVLKKLRDIYPDYSEEKRIEYLETLEAFCELVINYTLQQNDVKEK